MRPAAGWGGGKDAEVRGGLSPACHWECLPEVSGHVTEPQGPVLS